MWGWIGTAIGTWLLGNGLQAAEWPYYLGPPSSLSGFADYQLIDEVTRSRPMWTSEAITPPAKAQHPPRYGGRGFFVPDFLESRMPVSIYPDGKTTPCNTRFGWRLASIMSP